MGKLKLHVKKSISFFILLCFDFIIMWVSISSVYLIRLHTTRWFNEPMLESIEFYNQLTIYYVVVLLFMINEGIYHKHFDFWEEIKRIYRGLMIGVLVVFSYLALTKQAEEFSRFVIFATFLLMMFVFPILKRLIKYILVKINWWLKPVQLVGNSKDISTLYDEFSQNWYLGIKVVPHASTVIFATKGYNIDELSSISEKYMLSSKEVLFVPTLSQVNFSDANIVELHNARLSLIEVKNRLKEPFNISLKIGFDFLISIAILPILFFALVIISLLIKIDSKGNVFFRQKRLGKNLSTFYCYKFRTMYENADILLESYLKDNPEEVKYYNTYHKYKHDPRITLLGNWLRRTSLDELPQVINVILGEMSIIGPRPYMIEERHKIGKVKGDILLVKPGITGLWQISGRSNISFKDRIELDRWYVRNWTLWLDFTIFIKTFKAVIVKQGAK